MKFRRCLLTMLVLAIFPTLVSAADVVVITNSSVPTASLSKRDLRNIYQGKQTTWDSGSDIVFVVLKESAVHEKFLKEYIGNTQAQYDTFWKKQVFTGKGMPPQEFDSDQAMIDFVAKTPGAIGYVSSLASMANVKTIKVQ